MTGRTVPVALKLRVENGRAPVFFVGRRGRGHRPARLAGARRRLRRKTQENGGDAARIRGKAEPSRGREIENFRLARNLEHDPAQVRTGERLEPGSQRVGGIGRPHQEKPRRIDAEFEEPGRRKFAMLECGKVLANPEEMFLLRFMLQQLLQHKCSKTARRPTVHVARKDIVQRANAQTTTQTSIGFGMAKRGKSLVVLRSEPRFFEGAFEDGQPFGMA